MTRSAEAMLDKAIAQARGLRIDDAVVRLRANECVRWTATARRAPWLPRWWPIAASFAAAAAAVLVILTLRGAPPGPSDAIAAPIVGVGSRVAIVTSPGAVYAVVAATAEQTEISVVSGAVTARLYPGASPHRLRMTADALEATATGTVYTLVMPPSRQPYAIVHEGRVEVRDRSGDHSVSTGQSWPASPSSPAIDAAAQQLERHALAASAAPTGGRTGGAPGTATGSDGPGSAAGSDTAGSASGSDSPGSDTAGSAVGSDGSTSEGSDAARPRSAPATAEDRWRRARQLRGQGHPRDALAILDELGKRADAVWSPIAIAEAMRIHGSVLADPRAVVQLGSQFLGRYPKHALVREVTDMLCRAHRALGETELPSACLMHGVE